VVWRVSCTWPRFLTRADALFHINCTGTFNVYQAAAEEGIKRVVSASSINALGFNFGGVPFQLSYLPIDEAHPTQTSDVYSLSKQILEDTADYFWRRDGISGVCLRLPFVSCRAQHTNHRRGLLAARQQRQHHVHPACPFRRLRRHRLDPPRRRRCQFQVRPSSSMACCIIPLPATSSVPLTLFPARTSRHV
jgi:nucleoside-diphosphate-sugar epimerase